ncbi:hypothetical protein [Streptomyces sp. CB02130]|uniref:hypothetical protein n=1 Tax=Streptomyces sp. CB02130 TaxID=1703934 RepID=UPI000AA70462|nr:hypothetical protein [Streptomyces sp. CB02130]
MSDLLKIDGAACSGSGVIVCQSMACASVTGTPVHLRHVGLDPRGGADGGLLGAV